MKYSEMNKHQKMAVRAIKEAFNWNVGGWYNNIMDGMEEDIPSIEVAKEIVYNEAMANAPKEIRFAGKEFCEKIVNHHFNKDEDAQEIWG